MLFSSCLSVQGKKNEHEKEGKQEEVAISEQHGELGDTWLSKRSSVQASLSQVRSLSLPSSRCSKLTVTFCNDSANHALELCWVDEEGAWHHFYEIAPGGEHTELTFLGHAFLIRHKRTQTTQIQEEKCVIAAYRPMRLFTREQQSTLDNKEQEDDEQRVTHLVRLASKDQVVHQHDNRTLGCTDCFGQKPLSWLSFANVKKQDIISDTTTNTYTTWTMSVHSKPHSHDPPVNTSNKHYTLLHMVGQWNIHCQPHAFDQPPNHHPHNQRRFTSDLYHATQDLPPHAYTKLSKTTHFWINSSQTYGPISSPTVGKGMCYHPSADWLTSVGMSPQKCHGIELYQASTYADDAHLWEPGGVLLHELAHAYHHLHLPHGYDNQEIAKCYQQAMQEKLYDLVPVHGPQGPSARAYACTDEYEYFAELSVAYLGGYGGQMPSCKEEQEQEQEYELEHNKWFPFNRTQLCKHDPRGYALMKRMWWDIVSEEQNNEEEENEEHLKTDSTSNIS